MKKSDNAVASFKSGFTCSSAVFSSFSEDLGLAGESAKELPADLERVYQKRATSAVRYLGRSLSSG
jgi:hypothetical protein